MGKFCAVHKAAWVLVIIGALNWGLIGAFKFNLVNSLLGTWPTVERVAYVVVGLAALSMFLCGSCKKCKTCDGK